MARMLKSACRKTGNRILKIWSSIIAFFLGITGVGCTYVAAAEYGMPYSELTLHGTVTDKSTSLPIEGIRVSATDEEGYPLHDNEYYTDENGEYSLIADTTMACDIDVTMNFEDVDEDENGSYNDQDVVVSVKEEDFTNDAPASNWDNGDADFAQDAELDPQ